MISVPLITGDYDFDHYFWMQFADGLWQAFYGGVPADDAASMFLENFGKWAEHVTERLQSELTNARIDQMLGYEPEHPSTFVPTKEWHEFLDGFRAELATREQAHFDERRVAIEGFLVKHLKPEELN